MSQFPREPIPDSDLDMAQISEFDRVQLRQLEQAERPWSKAELAWVQRLSCRVWRAIA
jgi:hypothetical protein